MMASKEWLTDSVRELLESLKVHYSFYEEEIMDFFEMNFPLECALSPMNERIFISDRRILFRVTSPIKARKDQYNDVVEYLTRANYSLMVGGFEFDYRDGEISFRNCLTIGGDEISKKDFKTDFLTEFMLSHQMMNRYGDGLVKSLIGYGNPEADIAVAEGKTRE